MSARQRLFDLVSHEELELPLERRTFRDELVLVVAIEAEARGGSSGKVRVRHVDSGEERIYYPGVLRTYLNERPRV